MHAVFFLQGYYLTQAQIIIVIRSHLLDVFIPEIYRQIYPSASHHGTWWNGDIAALNLKT